MKTIYFSIIGLLMALLPMNASADTYKIFINGEGDGTDVVGRTFTKDGIQYINVTAGNYLYKVTGEKTGEETITTTVPVRIGKFNDKTVYSIGDITALVNRITSNAPYERFADVNNDQVVNAADIAALVGKLKDNVEVEIQNITTTETVTTVLGYNVQLVTDWVVDDDSPVEQNVKQEMQP